VKISVIILNWNRPNDTIAAVESALAQRFDDFDVLIWDNASSDNSKQVLTDRFRGQPRVRLTFADANYGVAGGRNRAFRAADGQLLLSLDSDAVIESPDALSKVTTRMQQDPSIGVVSFEVKRPDGHLMWPFSRPAAHWRDKEFETIRMDGCAFAVRREAFERVGGFAEHFSPYGAEDQHFAAKLMGAGYRVLYFPAAAVIHAWSEGGRTAEQFTLHVRNRLWVPIELFPFPYSLISSGKLGISLLRDALQEHQVRSFIRGLKRTVTEFRFSHRQPIPLREWRRMRRIIAEDKALAAPR